MRNILESLHRSKLLAPRALFHLAGSFLAEGTNLVALVRFSARLHPGRIALREGPSEITIEELHRRSLRMACLLRDDHGVVPDCKVALACRNHIDSVVCLFSLSRLGAHVDLLNVEQSPEQLAHLIMRRKFDLILHDSDLSSKFPGRIPSHRFLDVAEISSRATKRTNRDARLPRHRSGRITVLTGGTAGTPKPAGRQPSIFGAALPMLALLGALRLDRCRSMYIATPIYHGYGLAFMVLAIFLRKETSLTRRYRTADALSMIQAHAIESAILVPLMLGRMMAMDPTSLASLRCIVSGGAILPEPLARGVIECLGDVLYNLYGTSEAGFSVIATPECLRRNPSTLGRPLRGVSLRIQDDAGQFLPNGSAGTIHIRSGWSTKPDGDGWISTGDIGYLDSLGSLFLSGRADRMIVSGGENVFPEDVEQILTQHADIQSCACLGIPDSEFGQRLIALVEPRPNHPLTEASLLPWLSSRAARYQMPVRVEIVDALPMTSVGKVDYKAVRSMVTE